ncbi:hypothetical protein D3C71_1629580 [compost metagenome]
MTAPEIAQSVSSSSPNRASFCSPPDSLRRAAVAVSCQRSRENDTDVTALPLETGAPRKALEKVASLNQPIFHALPSGAS